MILQLAKNNIIISINTKMTIKMFATNNRIIIKESFAEKALKSSYCTIVFEFEATTVFESRRQVELVESLVLFKHMNEQ